MDRSAPVIYVFGDGDRVRERIEALLLSNNLPALRSLSKDLTEGIEKLANEFSRKMAAEVWISGGDDLLVSVPQERYSREKVEELANQYKTDTGTHISFGIGPTIESAYLNLRRAKSSATEKIVATEGAQ